jgi:hypothetical protein
MTERTGSCYMEQCNADMDTKFPTWMIYLNWIYVRDVYYQDYFSWLAVFTDDNKSFYISLTGEFWLVSHLQRLLVDANGSYKWP